MIINSPIELPEPKQPKKSLFDEDSINLSGSGSFLDGFLIERNICLPNYEYDADLNNHSRYALMTLNLGDSVNIEFISDGRRKKIEFLKNDINLNPGGSVSWATVGSRVEHLVLLIDSALINRVAREINSSWNVALVPRHCFQDELFRLLALNLISEFEHEAPPDRVYAESLMHTFVAYLIKHYSVTGVKEPPLKNGLPPRKLTHIIEYINDHLGDQLTLQYIADIVGMTPSYFITLFKQSTGLAPHQYITMRRLETAKAMLKQTRKPISEIAMQTGFADQSHLTRLMRQHTGLTPRRMRGE